MCILYVKSNCVINLLCIDTKYQFLLYFREKEILKLKTEAQAETENPKEIPKRVKKEKKKVINRKKMKTGTKTLKGTPLRKRKNKKGKEAEQPNKEEKQKKTRGKETQNEKMMLNVIKDRKGRKKIKEEEKQTD